MLKHSDVKMLRCRGFSIIEFLVVIFIIGILAAIVLANYRAGEKQLALQRAASKLAQDIRRVQEMAMSAKECQPCGGGIPSGGYGIYLKKNDNFYILYADVSGNKKYETGDTDIEKIYLEKGVFIFDLKPSSASINFTPPDPEVTMVDQAGSLWKADVEITLRIDSGKQIRVFINEVGRIWIF